MNETSGAGKPKRLLLKNAEYYTPEGFRRGDILLADGKIAEIFEITENFTEVPAEAALNDVLLYDAAGKKILPGAIDTHVHVREPGSPEKEDFLSGSAAALAGGVTTICQMPNTSPMPHDLASLQATFDAAAKSLCNVAVYAAAGYDNRGEFAALKKAGVCGLKTFLQPGKPGEPQYITVASDNDDELCELLAAAKEAGLRCFFHCEDYGLIGRLEEAAHAAGEEGYDFHYKTRPDEAELNAVRRVLNAARQTGAAVGIVHVSTPAAAEEIKRAKAEGLDVTCEICFHHLFFDDSWLDRFGPYAKCNPPLRSAEDVAAMWQYLADGTADYLGSDHAPHLLADKQKGEENIWLAPSGVAHIELMLPLLLTAASEGRITLERVAELLCVNGYKTMGLYPRKGVIAPGADADLVVVDCDKEWAFDSALMQTKAREACRHFDGLSLKGAVEASIVNGQLVYAAGRVDNQCAYREEGGRVLDCYNKM
jgi:allantoinase